VCRARDLAGALHLVGKLRVAPTPWSADALRRLGKWCSVDVAGHAWSVVSLSDVTLAQAFIHGVVGNRDPAVATHLTSADAPIYDRAKHLLLCCRWLSVLGDAYGSFTGKDLLAAIKRDRVTAAVRRSSSRSVRLGAHFPLLYALCLDATDVVAHMEREHPDVEFIGHVYRTVLGHPSGTLLERPCSGETSPVHTLWSAVLAAFAMARFDAGSAMLRAWQARLGTCHAFTVNAHPYWTHEANNTADSVLWQLFNATDVISSRAAVLVLTYLNQRQPLDWCAQDALIQLAQHGHWHIVADLVPLLGLSRPHTFAALAAGAIRGGQSVPVERIVKFTRLRKPTSCDVIARLCIEASRAGDTAAILELIHCKHAHTCAREARKYTGPSAVIACRVLSDGSLCAAFVSALARNCRATAFWVRPTSHLGMRLCSDVALALALALRDCHFDVARHLLALQGTMPYDMKRILHEASLDGILQELDRPFSPSDVSRLLCAYAVRADRLSLAIMQVIDVALDRAFVRRLRRIARTHGSIECRHWLATLG
jgi:hypothetical protein